MGTECFAGCFCEAEDLVFFSCCVLVERPGKKTANVIIGLCVVGLDKISNFYRDDDIGVPR